MQCPNCGAEETKRGGNTVWTIYLVLIAAALVAVLAFHLNAAIVAGIIIGVIVIVHLLLDQRVCLECGHQWGSRS
jgi:hypothetical protein